MRLSSSPIGLFGQDIIAFVAAFEGTLRRLTLALPHYRDMELQLTAPHLERQSGVLDLSVLVLRHLDCTCFSTSASPSASLGGVCVLAVA